MPIVKDLLPDGEHRPGFTLVSNGLLNDRRLSSDARFVAAWLLQQYPGWVFSKERIARQAGMSSGAVRRAWAELKAAGYLVTKRVRNSAGELSWLNTLHEVPQQSAEEEATEGSIADLRSVVEKEATESLATEARVAVDGLTEPFDHHGQPGCSCPECDPTDLRSQPPLRVVS